VTVSGLARGIDAEAHLGTVAAGGRGVAVLGSGSNVVYPAEHRGLHDALLGLGGAVLTEYPPGTPPEAWRFPPRNRVISGLAGAVVVVEAAVKGGALITASAAAEQGRAVLAVPGDIDREASEGCNLLIRDGAIPVLDAADLIEALSLILGTPRAQDPVPGPGHAVDAAVLAAIGPAGTAADGLAAATGLPASEVLAAVARLEASGHIGRVGSRLIAGPGR
jgi:DNA processing protein